MEQAGQEDHARNTVVSERQTAVGLECVRGATQRLVTRAQLARLPSTRECVSKIVGYAEYLATLLKT